MNKKDKIIVAAAAGVVIAGAITLLFTTKEGKKIRKNAKEKGKKLMSDLKKMEENFSCRNEKKEQEAPTS